MRGQLEFFDVDDRLKRLSDLGDRLEAFRAAVDFELFRAELNVALSYSDGSEGGRPPFDPVMMFKILVIQATNNVSDERVEFLINDRLSFMRFLGLGLADRVPDARTILFREKLTNAGAIKTLFQRFDATLRQAGLHRHVGTDHRCQPGCRAAPAQQRGREAGDQRRPHPERLEGQARQAAPEGPRCALDGQVQQGQAARRRLDRLRLRLHPPMDCNRRRGCPAAVLLRLHNHRYAAAETDNVAIVAYFQLLGVDHAVGELHPDRLLGENVAFAYVDRRLPQSRFVTGRRDNVDLFDQLKHSLFMS